MSHRNSLHLCHISLVFPIYIFSFTFQISIHSNNFISDLVFSFKNSLPYGGNIKIIGSKVKTKAA